ncbi:glycoside hydrolase family 5 protein [Chiua virens]|nr:glycoside hydrolase family 5 protein [Chiua virens]
MVLKTLSVLALAATAVQSLSHLKFAGVNIAGFGMMVVPRNPTGMLTSNPTDFGCSTDGTCNAYNVCPPLKQLGCKLTSSMSTIHRLRMVVGADGLSQMQHFKEDGYNAFRLPVGWQYLTLNQMTGVLNDGQFAKYNMLVEACLSTGAHCVIDIHNYARYDGNIIGQGGPSNEMFAEFWHNIASYWKNETRIIFGLMNEPHDMPDMTTWTNTVQAAVTAVRSAGATSQIILLPGDNWTRAATFVSGGSADLLNTVKNPDGTTKNLVMDVHQYLDSDYSGTHTDCVTNNIDAAWKPLVTWLRAHSRQALNTETGGGNVDSCVEYLTQQIDYQTANSDVIIGYLGWAAGSFSTDYTLSETPYYDGTTWTDQMTVLKVLSPKVS